MAHAENIDRLPDGAATRDAIAALDRGARVARGLDHVGDRSLAHTFLEGRVRDDVTGAGTGLARRPLDDVDLRPRPWLVNHAVGALDSRVPGVDLCKRNEVLGRDARCRREIAPVKLFDSDAL